MKTIIIATVVLFCNSLMAQKNGIFRIGGNLASFSNDDPATGSNVIEVSNRFGYAFGVGMESNNTRIKTKLLLNYSNQGHTRKLTNGKEIFNVSYVQLNAYANFFDIKKLEISAGPQLGYMIANKITKNGTPLNSNDSLNKFDIGVNFDFNYPLNKNKTAAIYALWNVGFIDVLKGNAEGTNNVIQIGIQFTIPNKKK